MGAAGHEVHHGRVPQGGQGGHGGRGFRHGRIYGDYGESRGNGGADGGICQGEEPGGGAVCP